MEWLNYHHLLYFWVVAREGTISRACRELKLAQPTISAQLKSLEDRLGEPLFVREGKKLRLTPTGHTVYRYAESIFALGRELMDVLRERPTDRPLPLVVGVSDVVPKLIAYHLIQPALKIPEPVKITCKEDTTDNLLAELAINHLNLVIADSPVPPSLKIRAFSHLLGECGVSFLAKPSLLKGASKDFPRSLDGSPFLLPTESTSLRRSLDSWFEAHKVHPKIVGEFDDSALLKIFGQAGMGIFPVPTAIEAEVIRHSRVVVVGRTTEICERYYAISLERKLKHPAVVEISKVAKSQFAVDSSFGD